MLSRQASPRMQKTSTPRSFFGGVWHLWGSTPYARVAVTVGGAKRYQCPLTSGVRLAGCRPRSHYPAATIPRYLYVSVVTSFSTACLHTPTNSFSSSAPPEAFSRPGHSTEAPSRAAAVKDGACDTEGLSMR